MNAEAAVIGMLLNEPPLFADCLEVGLEPWHFVDAPLRELYEKIASLDAQDGPWDAATVLVSLPDLAGVAIDLQVNAPVAQNFSFHAREVATAGAGRKTLGFVAAVQKAILRRQPGEDESAILDALHALQAQVHDSGRRNDTPTARESARLFAVDLDEGRIRREQGKPAGLPTGYTVLNQKIGGFRPECLYVLGARTGMGKTTLALNMAQAAAFAGAHVCFFTIEMSGNQIMARLMSSRARVPQTALANYTFNHEEEDRVGFQLERHAEGSLTINERAAFTIETFETECRRLRRAGRLDFAVLDYLQLMRVGARHFQVRSQELTEISMRVKQLAKTMKIPILALAQLNREATKEKGKRPNKAQLKDCGAIEQDADGIFLLHREDYYEDGDRTFLYLDKNRHGSEGYIELGADLAHNTFRDLDA